MIRVLVVDDHASSREPLAFLLDREEDLQVVAQAGSVADALARLENVDVALIDLNLPDGTGLDVIHMLRRRSPTAEALVLTGSTSRQDHARAIEAGAAGVLNKTVSISEIMTAIRKLHRGEPLYSAGEILEVLRSATQLRDEDDRARWRLSQLTPRERELLQALAEGLSDKEIAERLSLSVRTAQTHMAHILSKLEVSSRLQALLVAVRYGEVQI